VKFALAGRKVTGSVQLFQRELFIRNILTDLKIRKKEPGRLSKALGAAPKNHITNWSKGFELGGF
jgi:hypothetical protein